jgi:hypothetical protein
LQQICIAAYRERESDRDKDRTPVRCEDITLVTVREQCFISEPVETKYLNFSLLLLLGSSRI